MTISDDDIVSTKVIRTVQLTWPPQGVIADCLNAYAWILLDDDMYRTYYYSLCVGTCMCMWIVIPSRNYVRSRRRDGETERRRVYMCDGLVPKLERLDATTLEPSVTRR